MMLTSLHLMIKLFKTFLSDKNELTKKLTNTKLKSKKLLHMSEKNGSSEEKVWVTCNFSQSRKEMFGKYTY